MKNNALEFLKHRTLIKEGNTDFLMTGDFGTVSLVELLNEFHEEQKAAEPEMKINLNIQKLIENITLKITPEELEEASNNPKVSIESIETIVTKKLTEILKQ